VVGHTKREGVLRASATYRDGVDPAAARRTLGRRARLLRDPLGRALARQPEMCDPAWHDRHADKLEQEAKNEIALIAAQMRQTAERARARADELRAGAA
jgi:hypothetical protein